MNLIFFDGFDHIDVISSKKKHNCKSLLLSAIVIVCMKYEIRQVMKSTLSHLSSGDPFSETEKGFGVSPTPV